MEANDNNFSTQMGKNGFLVKASETNCSKSQLEKEYK